MTDLKLPELPDSRMYAAPDTYRRYHEPTGRTEPYYSLAQLKAYATAAVLAERAARGKTLADGYAGSMFGTSPSGDQQRVVLYYKTAEQALAAHDWLCDTLDAAINGSDDDAR